MWGSCVNGWVDGAHSSVAVSSQAVREAALLLSTLQAQKTLALFTASTLISPEQVCVCASVCVRASMDLSDLLFSFRWMLCIRVCVCVCVCVLLHICMGLTVYV